MKLGYIKEGQQILHHCTYCVFSLTDIRASWIPYLQLMNEYNFDIEDVIYMTWDSCLKEDA